MNKAVTEILQQVKETCDFGYVEFSEINSTNSFGDNALHCIAIWGNCEMAKALIDAGININQHGEMGYTPLHNAISHGHIKLVKLLLESGANPFARTLGEQAYTLAKVRGKNEICNTISEYIKSHKLSDPSISNVEHLNQLKAQKELLEKQINEHCSK
jgi:ankyrin repeat protein